MPEPATLGIKLFAPVRVLAGLKDKGVAPKSAIAWLPVVLQLIATFGPLLTEIIEAIKKAIDDGHTPETFMAEPK